ncbi:hypothetical protein L1887_15202 [Cichorium endivia]|nr:hypothetical protein L1887_15202 [Cichorium endivia]
MQNSYIAQKAVLRILSRRQTKNSPLRTCRGKPKTRALFASHLSLKYRLESVSTAFFNPLFNFGPSFISLSSYALRFASSRRKIHLLSPSLHPFQFKPTKISLTSSITPIFDSNPS